MSSSNPITSTCYEQTCFQHDQEIYKCAVNSNFHAVSQLLLNANKRGTRMEHKWREYTQEEDCATVTEAYTAGDTELKISANSGCVQGDIINIGQTSTSYIVGGLSSDNNTLTIDPTGGENGDLMNGENEDIPVGTKIRKIRPASESGCYDDGCKPEQPIEKSNFFQIFESCPIEVTKHAKIEAENGGVFGIKDLMAEGMNQQLVKLLDEMNYAVHWGIKRPKGSNNEPSMGGMYWFINQAIKDHPDVDICIDAGPRPDPKNPDVEIIPEIGTVINDALQDIMTCGGNATVIMTNANTARAIRQQYKCKDYCNVYYLDRVVGDVPAQAFESDLAGKDGNQFLGILVDPFMADGEMLIGDFSTAQLIPFKGCEMEAEDISNRGCKGQRMVLHGTYTLEMKNIKCNWRKVKNIDC